MGHLKLWMGGKLLEKTYGLVSGAVILLNCLFYPAVFGQTLKKENQDLTCDNYLLLLEKAEDGRLRGFCDPFGSICKAVELARESGQDKKKVYQNLQKDLKDYVKIQKKLCLLGFMIFKPDFYEQNLGSLND